MRFVDEQRQPFQAVSSDPSIAGGVFVTASGFVSDAITVGKLLTINAGVRFDHSRAISQDLPVLDAQGRETDDMVGGLGTLYTWNVWSPRLGVTMKTHRRRPDDAARELRAIQSGRADWGARPLSSCRDADHHGWPSTPATGGYTTLVSVVDPKQKSANSIPGHAHRGRTSTQLVWTGSSGAGSR